MTVSSPPRSGREDRYFRDKQRGSSDGPGVEQSVSPLARILIVLMNKKLFPRGKHGGARIEDTVPFRRFMESINKLSG
jgi:hypothetical protein